MKLQQASTTADLAALYDEDFFAWTERNAELLRSGHVSDADIAHIAEEIEGQGQLDTKEMYRRVRAVLVYLLKWQLQPEKRPRSWKVRIVSERIEIELLLKQSPSLETKVCGKLADLYAGAVRLAAAQTGLARDQFPKECPFTLEQIFDLHYMPTEAG